MNSMKSKHIHLQEGRDREKRTNIYNFGHCKAKRTVHKCCDPEIKLLLPVIEVRNSETIHMHTRFQQIGKATVDKKSQAGVRS